MPKLSSNIVVQLLQIDHTGTAVPQIPLYIKITKWSATSKGQMWCQKCHVADKWGIRQFLDRDRVLFVFLRTPIVMCSKWVLTLSLCILREKKD